MDSKKYSHEVWEKSIKIDPEVYRAFELFVWCVTMQVIRPIGNQVSRGCAELTTDCCTSMTEVEPY